MCLGVPGRVVDVDGSVATVDFFGVRRSVRLEVVDEPVAPGDYILNHVVGIVTSLDLLKLLCPDDHAAERRPQPRSVIVQG